MVEAKILMFAAVGGFIGAFALPSLATQYWMWKEREEYRWVLVGSWIAVAIILIALWFYLKRR